MVIELSEDLERMLTARAYIRGVSAEAYFREVLERGLELPTGIEGSDLKPFKSGLGMLAKYGISISEKDIDENRAEMFRNFGEDF